MARNVPIELLGLLLCGVIVAVDITTKGYDHALRWVIAPSLIGFILGFIIGRRQQRPRQHRKAHHHDCHH